MTRIIRYVFWFCLSLFILVLGGCTAKEIEYGIQQDITEEEGAVTDGYEPVVYEGPTVTVTDSAGRTVDVPYKPERIGTLYATTGHIVAMLDHGSDIVAVNNGLKRDKLFNQLEPGIESAALTVISGQINIETLLEKQVTLAMIPLDIYQDSKQISQLETLGIAYVVVDYQSIEEQIKAVQMIGQILGSPEEARLYEEFYQEVIEILDQRLGDLDDSERTRVYHSINEANCTVERGTLPEDWMHYAGGINVSLDGDLEKDGDKYYTSLEQILLWNPAVIYCNESGVPDYIMNSEQWSQIDAVKSDRVVQLPVGISRWGHKTSVETPLAMLWVAEDLYPQRFEDLDLLAYYQRFYRELFEFDLTEDTYEAMVLGDGMRLSKDLEEQ